MNSQVVWARALAKGFARKKKPLEELQLEDLDKVTLKKYEAEYQKMMAGENDKELDKFLDRMGFHDLKNLDKLDPRALEKQFEKLMEKTHDLDSLELEQFAKSIMQEDPYTTKHASLITKSAQGVDLTEEEKEYLHVIGLLEQRDMKEKYGEIYSFENEDQEDQQLKYAKVKNLENSEVDTKW